MRLGLVGERLGGVEVAAHDLERGQPGEQVGEVALVAGVDGGEPQRGQLRARLVVAGDPQLQAPR